MLPIVLKHIPAHSRQLFLCRKKINVKAVSFSGFSINTPNAAEKPVTVDPEQMNACVEVQSDESLIDRAKKDPQAFRGLYERYYRLIFNFILKRVNEKETSADITQQVFFNALTGLKRYEHQGHAFSAFLYRIAINECNQYFRHHKKARFVAFLPEYSEHMREELIVTEEDNIDLHERLGRAVGQLDHEQLLLLELRFFERKPFGEIAYLLNVTENLAKVKTYRLLDKLKTMIENEKK